MSIDLSAYFSGQVFAFLLVFSRLAAAIMTFPGIGESFVPPRVRMLFALAFSFMLFPVLSSYLPSEPQNIPDLALLVGKEIFIGLFFGSITRLLMDIIATAGSVLAMEIGLSNAMIFNPSLAAQSALPSAFLGIVSLVLLFASGLDHFLLRAIVNTYAVFPVGREIIYGDIVETFIHLVSQSFSIGIQLAAPFMVAGLLLYTVLGIMQRMMPQIQLFLVMIPVQIMGGFFVFGLVVASLLAVWLKVFNDVIGSLFF